jgi:protocatechuate 3,4-dioxygenase beta subunit
MASIQIELPITRAQTEGPYWRPGSLARTNLRESDTKGEPIIVRGHVVNIRGMPIAGA